VEDPSPSLQALVATGLDSLQVRGARVVDEPFHRGESDEVPRWLPLIFELDDDEIEVVLRFLEPRPPQEDLFED
jgi:hypothetical protein